VPTCYDAITDLVVRTKPTTAAPASAGLAMTDPMFGSRILRVTDGSTRPGAPGRSYGSPSGSHQNVWSVGAKYFYVVSTDGTVIPFTFDAATLKASRIQASTTGDGGITLKLWGEPQFSFVSDSIIYGIYSGSGTNLRTLSSYNFTTGTYTSILDLDTIVSGLSGTYVGGLSSSAGSVERLAVFFGGMSQDQHYYVVVLDRANPASRRVLNTMASTVDGAATNIVLNFHLHHAFMDKSGRYVMLYPTIADRQAPRSAAASYLWDLTTNQFAAMTALPMGHDAIGYGYYANQDCCISSTWDAAQWQLRSLAAPQTSRDIISPVLMPKEIYLADHQSWTNAQPSAMVPFISGNYRYGTNTTAWRPWDEEILAIQTDLAPGVGATVWRFAHHRSNVANDNDPTTTYFWYEPRPIVSQDGRWALFTSNWDKTLGTDSAGQVGGLFRQDAFIVELKAPGAVSTAPLQISTTSIPPGTVGSPYSATLQSTGGSGTTTWSMIGGALPAGVTFGANGVISGTPSSVGTFTISVRATDANSASNTATAVVTLVVTASAFTASIPPAPAGRIGLPYRFAGASTTGAVGVVTWTVASGALPVGIGLDVATGVIAGTPTTSGSFTAVVQAKDSFDPVRVASAPVTISIAPLPITIATVSLPDASVRQTYRSVLVASGGTGQTVWTLASGSLPNGLALSSAGVITGSPTSVGMSTFTVQASDAGWAGNVASQSLTIAVRAREILLYASDAVKIAGTWSLVADATAAGGTRLWNPNLGAAKLATPLATPVNYFDITFEAEAGVAYHFWLRGKADNDFWGNDSVMIQFSGSVDANGNPMYRIGTTSGGGVNLEDCSGCGESGWGWQDNGWGVNVFGPNIYFAQAGPQTLRVQVKEDGFSIDQIVLSGGKYLTSAPGALKNDTTILIR